MLQLLTINVSRYTGEELASNLEGDRFTQTYLINTDTNIVEEAEDLSITLQPGAEYYLFDVELGLQWLDLEVEEQSVLEFFKTVFTDRGVSLGAVFSNLPNPMPSGSTDYPTKDYLVFDISSSGEIVFFGILDKSLEKIPYTIKKIT